MVLIAHKIKWSIGGWGLLGSGWTWKCICGMVCSGEIGSMRQEAKKHDPSDSGPPLQFSCNCGINHVQGCPIYERDFYKNACIWQAHEVEQTLGQALGYPWFKDDQKNFPGATEEQGVCVGDHVAESLAIEAARYIKRLESILTEIAEVLNTNGKQFSNFTKMGNS